MPIFTRSSCIAMTWNADRQCNGVLVRRAGEFFRVEAIWQGQPADGSSLGSCLADGFQQLGGDETVTIAAGPAGLPCGLTDLILPKLPPDELRKALAFELTRQAPVATEKLTWGYRLLPEAADEPGKQIVRLFYVRNGDWQKMLDEIGNLRSGVDIILPPVAALDPVLAGRPVFLSAGHDTGFLLTPEARRGRGVIAVTPAPVDSQAFGSLPEPCRMPELLLPPALTGLSPEQQQDYSSALLLAMYGLQRQAASDAATRWPIPRELRVHRNRGGRMTALFLALYLLMVTGVAAWQRYHMADQYYRQLREQNQVLKQKIKSFGGREDLQNFITLLETEFKDANFERPPLTVCLMELTQRIGNDAWVQSLTWVDGKLEIEISTTTENFDIVSKLEESPVLADVMPLRKSLDPNNVLTIRLQMNAVFEAPASLPEKASPVADKTGVKTDSISAPPTPLPPPPPPQLQEQPPSQEQPQESGTPLAVPPPPPPPPVLPPTAEKEGEI